MEGGRGAQFLNPALPAGRQVLRPGARGRDGGCGGCGHRRGCAGGMQQVRSMTPQQQRRNKVSPLRVPHGKRGGLTRHGLPAGFSLLRNFIPGNQQQLLRPGGGRIVKPYLLRRQTGILLPLLLAPLLRGVEQGAVSMAVGLDDGIDTSGLWAGRRSPSRRFSRPAAGRPTAPA